MLGARWLDGPHGLVREGERQSPGLFLRRVLLYYILPNNKIPCDEDSMDLKLNLVTTVSINR